jgi:alpha-L-fucosidase
MGAWMKINGAAIYGTTASPFANLGWGRCTTRQTGTETTLYLHVFDWPASGQLVVPGLKSKAKSVTLLASQQQLTAANTAAGLAISLPATAPDKLSTTIAVQLQGALEIHQP